MDGILPGERARALGGNGTRASARGASRHARGRDARGVPV